MLAALVHANLNAANWLFALAVLAALITIAVCIWKRSLEPALIAVVLTFIALGACFSLRWPTPSWCTAGVHCARNTRSTRMSARAKTLKVTMTRRSNDD